MVTPALVHVRGLQLGHLLLDQPEPLDRVDHVDRQVVQQGGDLVVGTPWPSSWRVDTGTSERTTARSGSSPRDASRAR